MTDGKPLIVAVDWAADVLATVELNGRGLPASAGPRPVGGNPRAVAAVAAGRMYVCDYGSDTVSLLEKSTGRHPLPAPGHPCAVVAGLHAGQVCVAAWAQHSVHVYGADKAGPWTVPTGERPFALAAAPGGTRVCVACEDAAVPLAIIDVSKPGSPVPVRPGVVLPSPAAALAVSPDGNFAYAACRARDGKGDGTLTVVDLRAGHEDITGTFAVGAEPVAVVVAASGDRLCVVNHGSASVSVATLDRNTGAPGRLTAFPVGLQPSAAAFAPDGGVLYVASRVTGMLSAVHLAGAGSDGRVRCGARRDVPVGAVPASVVCGPSGTHVHVTDQGTGELVTVRGAPERGASYGTGVSSGPVSVALSPDGRWACAADSAARRVAVHDVTAPPATAKELGLPVEAARPWGIAVGTAAQKPSFACVTSPGTGHVFTLRPQQGGSLGTPEKVTCQTTLIGGRAAPHGVAITPDGRYALTADAGAGTVSRIDLEAGTARRKLYTIPKDVVQCAHPFGVAVAGDTLFVTDTDGAKPGEQKGILSVLRHNGGNWQHVQTVKAGEGHFHGPIGLAVYPYQQKPEYLYVGNYESQDAGSARISVLRNQGGKWSHHKDITCDELTRPHGLAVSRDGKNLYVASTDKGKVAQFTLDAGHNATFKCWLSVRPQPDAYVPSWLALSQDGTHLYATDLQSGKLFGLRVPVQQNTSMRKVEGIDVLAQPRGIVCEGDTLVHLVCDGKGENKPSLVTITLDGNRLKAKSVSSPLVLDNKPYAVAARDNGPLYVTEYEKGTVTAYGGGITTIPVKKQDDSRPWEVVCTPDGRFACVTDRSTKGPSVHGVALAGLGVTTLAVTTEPAGVATAPDGMRVYVAHRGGTVTLLCRAPEFTGEPVKTADGEAPRAVAVHPKASYAYRLRTAGLCPVKLTGTDDGQNLPLMKEPAGLAIANDGFAYVVGTVQPGKALLQVVALSDAARPGKGNSVILNGGTPTGIALHPGRKHGYAAGRGGSGNAGLLWVITLSDPAAPVVSATVRGVPVARDLAVRAGSPDHLYLLCADGENSVLHTLEVPAAPAGVVAREAGRLALPGKPWALDLHPSGGYGLVATEDKGVHLVDLTDPARPRLERTTSERVTGAVGFLPDGHQALHARKQELRQLVLGAPHVRTSPWATGLGTAERIAVAADGSEVYVTGGSNGTVRAVDAATGTLRFTVPLGTALGGLVASPDRQRLFVADSRMSAVMEMCAAAPTCVDRRVIGVDVRQAACLDPGASG
ncbi:beta-propeller fold lactonase family protein [Streptomyces cinnamoneus]|uniref:beta-propeller fold lactonase family protein n=1 Tax=Streptomyces cinnamoneus TaxID=53446 RepID=UPI0033ECE300